MQSSQNRASVTETDDAKSMKSVGSDDMMASELNGDPDDEDEIYYVLGFGDDDCPSIVHCLRHGANTHIPACEAEPIYTSLGRARRGAGITGKCADSGLAGNSGATMER